MWVLYRLAPDAIAYNVPLACRLSGRLDVAAFRQAFDDLVARHEIMRTRYVENVDGVPEAHIDPVGPQLVIATATGETQITRDAAASDAFQADWSAPFDLAACPPVRARLTKLDDYEYVFSTIIHHIGYDAGSEQVFWHDLGTLYSAVLSGRRAVLPELDIQYVDYAAWQRGQNGWAEQIAYWRETLAGVEPLKLPVDRPPPARRTFEGARICFCVDEEVTEGLRQIARAAGTTVFTVLLAAFQAVLGHICATDDIVVGSPVVGRNRPETECMIGYFSNTVVLRTDCGDDPTFVELLARVREVVNGAYAHQDVPFERVVQTLGPRRDPSRTPFVDVIFSSVPLAAFTSAESVHLPQLTVTPIDMASTTSIADLLCSVTETPDSITGDLTYRTDLFDAETVEGMKTSWLGLLKAAVSDPQQPLSMLTSIHQA
jgi:hypothetical protein